MESIVAGDEMCAFHFTPETKERIPPMVAQIVEVKNWKVTPSAAKVMATIFGLLMVDFMPVVQ